MCRYPPHRRRVAVCAGGLLVLPVFRDVTGWVWVVSSALWTPVRSGRGQR
jgi:hypothetical protein